MKALAIQGISDLNQDLEPLKWIDCELHEPGEKEILIQVSTCGVCHTEIDEIEGRTPPPKYPIIPGHQVVGKITAAGSAAKRFRLGERVGVAWIFWACGKCKYCLSGDENLCLDFQATGRDANGGYAEFMLVAEDFAFSIPPSFSDSEAAPLLCAGAIGYRSLRLTNISNGQRLGLAGFGASAHLVLQLARHIYPQVEVFVFSRSPSEREFALQLGAAWVGDFGDDPGVKLEAVIDTTPAYKPIIEALDILAPGGRLVINAIRKETVDVDQLLRLDYPRHLWMEKEIKSVANVSRQDVSKFLELAAEMNIKPEYQEYSLKDANQALLELRMRKIRGAKVLKIG